MKPDPRFVGQPARFWANVKLVSEQVGYSVRGPRGQIKTLRKYSLDDVVRVYRDEGLDADFTNRERAFLDNVLAYMNYRADLIQNAVQPLLMDRDLLPNLPSIIRRVCSGYAPVWGVLRTQSV